MSTCQNSRPLNLLFDLYQILISILHNFCKKITYTIDSNARNNMILLNKTVMTGISTMLCKSETYLIIICFHLNNAEIVFLCVCACLCAKTKMFSLEELKPSTSSVSQKLILIFSLLFSLTRKAVRRNATTLHLKQIYQPVLNDDCTS